ncbi:MAG: NERD domain-containing protein/DEAD/DEAH box helicase [Bacteroidales bacterium]|nr:NERD domain-containing protein/DEAD/DEAH box helicase [Candidatus Latescibacterota bacterium]
MAKMIPPRFDEATTSNAEHLLYFHLQNHLDDDWTVVHSLPWLDQSRFRLQQGECDFLLFHPSYGLLVLEVKSGTPHYDGSKQEWHYDDGKQIKDPFGQARTGMHFLNGLLNERSPHWRQAGLPYGYAVAFPDAASVTGSLRPDMGMDLLFLAPDLQRIQAAVIKLLSRFGPANPVGDVEVIKSVLGVLQPTFALVPSLAPTIALARRELIRLTEEQAFTLEGMGGNRRLLVRGGAGTGKTLLIITQARRLMAEGKRVLVLCFNRPLGALLRQELSSDPGKSFVGNFHEFCLEILRETEVDQPDPGTNDYWDVALPDAALTAMPDFEARYDAILVDEAQDFRSDWWLMIEEFLADPEESQFHIFGDDHQNLYGREGQLPFKKPEYILRRNCRNTAPIAKFARSAVGMRDDRALAVLPDGPQPVLHKVADAAQERDAVRRVLHELVQEQGVPADEIVILGCHKLENSSFTDGRKMGNLTIRDADSPEEPNTIRYSTVHKFKGLETDCVLLTGIGQPSAYYTENHMSRFRYVGGSRARVVLHVFEWGEQVC